MKQNEVNLAISIGKAISKQRKAAGLSQETVAERLSIGNEAVSRIERGAVMPTIARLVELADIFQCRLVDLLSESSNRSQEQGEVLTKLISGLSEKDRVFILDIIYKLTNHLNSQ